MYSKYIKYNQAHAQVGGEGLGLQILHKIEIKKKTRILYERCYQTLNMI